MALPAKTFQQFVNDMVAAWAAQLGFQPTLQKGDALFALMETTAAQLVFLQSQVALVNAVARASTSGSDLNNGTTDADLDSFFEGQFGFARQRGAAAVGAVTFSKFTASASQVLIPPGIVVQTVGGAVQYQTIADTAQPTWDPTLGAYVLVPGQTSLVATVQALAVGTAYNVAANQLSQIATPLAGIDTVNNLAAITTGTDAESNPAYRARFVLYINSLSKATYGAIVNAIEGVGFGLKLPDTFSLAENVNLALAPMPGEFVATVDNGAGNPPASLVNSVQAALEDVRGFTIEAHARAVTKVTPTISLSVRVAAGFVPTSVESAVAFAVAAVVNTTPVGGVDGVLLYVSEIEQAALAVAGVVAVRPGTLINGVNTDLAGTVFQAARCGPSDVTVGTY